MDLNVLIFGDLDFAAEVMHGIARLFMGGNEDSFHQATAVVMILMMFIASLKYFMDPEKNPYPFKEFIYSLIAWVIFVGPLSPRFDITLESFHEPLNVRTVDDIPFLAAIPAWATSNLFGGLRELMRDAFSPVGFKPGDGPDPLGSLVKLHKSIPPYNAAIAGDTSGETSFYKTLDTYISDCYITQEMINKDAVPTSMEKLIGMPMSRVLENTNITNPNLYTKSYLTSDKNGVDIRCTELHPQLVSLGNGPVQNEVVSFYEQIGVTTNSLYTAQQLMTAGSGPTENPYELMVGRLAVQALGSSLRAEGVDSFWADKMLSEATTSRAYKAAGERSMFLQYMVPLVSMFEMFAFYIAPIMMILAVMGGLGWSMLGKYMYLLLFVNLWGFIKVFVDLYTYLAVEKAFEYSAFSATSALSPAEFTRSIVEVESLLGVASSMTAAIPMLAMFLLYGGVHSLMGVMRHMNPSGSVDSSNMAPTTASTWDNGTAQNGKNAVSYNPNSGGIENDYKSSSNPVFGGANWSDTNQAVQSSISSAAKSQTASSVESFGEQASSLLNNSTQSGNGVQSTDKTSHQEQTMSQQTMQLANKLADNEDVSTKQAQAMATAFMFEQAAQAGFTLPGMGAGFKLSESDKDALTADTGISWNTVQSEAKTLSEQWSDSESHTEGNEYGISANWSNSEVDTDAFQSTSQALEQFQKQVSIQEQTSDQLSDASGLSDTYKVDKVGFASYANELGGELSESIWNTMKNTDNFDRFKTLSGADNAAEFTAAAMDKYGDTGLSIGEQVYRYSDDLLQESLANNGGTVEQEISDLAVASSLSGALYDAANGLGPSAATDVAGYQNLSNDLADLHKQMQSKEGTLETHANNEIDKNKGQGAEDRIQVAENALDPVGTQEDASIHAPSAGHLTPENVTDLTPEQWQEMVSSSPLTDVQKEHLDDIRSGRIETASQLSDDFNTSAENWEVAQAFAANSDEFSNTIFKAFDGKNLDRAYDGVSPFEKMDNRQMGEMFKEALTDGNKHQLAQLGHMQAFSNFLNTSEGGNYLSSLNQEERASVADNLETFNRLSNHYDGLDNQAGQRFDDISAINELRNNGDISNSAAHQAFGFIGGEDAQLGIRDSSFAYQYQNQSEFNDVMSSYIDDSSVGAYLQDDSDGIHAKSALNDFMTDSLMRSSYENAVNQEDGSIMSVDDPNLQSNDLFGSILDGNSELMTELDRVYRNENMQNERSNHIERAAKQYMDAGVTGWDQEELGEALATQSEAFQRGLDNFVSATGQETYGNYASIAYESATDAVTVDNGGIYATPSSKEFVPQEYKQDFMDGLDNAPAQLTTANNTELTNVGTIGDAGDPYAAVYQAEGTDDYYRVTSDGAIKQMYGDVNEMDDFNRNMDGLDNAPAQLTTANNTESTNVGTIGDAGDVNEMDDFNRNMDAGVTGWDQDDLGEVLATSSKEFVPQEYKQDFMDGLDNAPAQLTTANNTELTNVGTIGDAGDPYAAVYQAEGTDDYYRVTSDGAIKQMYGDVNEMDDFNRK